MDNFVPVPCIFMVDTGQYSNWFDFESELIKFFEAKNSTIKVTQGNGWKVYTVIKKPIEPVPPTPPQNTLKEQLRDIKMRIPK